MRLGIPVEPRHFSEGAKTAQDAASAIGCDVGQIVKSLIFGVDGEIVLAYVSGVHQLDEHKLAAAAGDSAPASGSMASNSSNTSPLKIHTLTPMTP